jgi:nitroreductase
MDVFEAIAQRHSYRGPFKDEPVSREDLTRIVQAGTQAPSGCNAQTTAFVIVDDQKLVRKIAVMHPKSVAFQQARAFIACVVDDNPEAVYERFSFQVEDCAAAVENMLLAVTALGYATVWIDGWLRVEGRAEIVAGLIGLPGGKRVRVLLPIGVPAETGPRREKKLFAQRAWFNSYGCDYPLP